MKWAVPFVGVVLTVTLLIGMFSCDARYEGAEPGDCSDGADNDADGSYDCQDEGCVSAPDCVDTGFRPGMLEDTPLCDAGDEAFVRRLMPQLWGRHPRSVREIDLLLQIIEQSDRATLVDLMLDSRAFVQRWSEVLKDILQINRIGERSGMGCGIGRSADLSAVGPTSSAALAAVVRDTSPLDAATRTGWNIHALAISAVILDDLSPLFRVQLFAQLGSKVVNLDNPGANIAWRGVYRELFERSYLGRRIACLPCHNSEYSVTDSPDPAMDRTWQLPGYFEQALFGNSGGRPAEDLSAFFRIEGVLAMEFVPDGVTPALFWQLGQGYNPWGLGEYCGAFIHPDEIEPDPEGWTGYFIEEVTDPPSVWHLERWLHSGFDSLRDGGLQMADDSSVGGEQAFAWLVSMNVAEQVWTEVMGRPLTVSHSFPRNRYQRDLLQYLTEVFVEGSFSLKSLVAAVVLHPYFNPGMPDQCEGLESPYYLAPVFDPWVVNHETEALRLNSPGDAAERLPPRVLISAVTEALEWPMIDPLIYDYWMDSGGHEQPESLLVARGFEIDLGVFMLDGEPGFRSGNFGAGMAWEDVVGRCVNPFPSDEGVDIDWIDRLLNEAPQDASLEAVTLSLKDRLLGRPDLSDPSERALVEALLQHPLETELSEVSDADAALRRVCSALLSAPDFLLAGAPGAAMIGHQLEIVPSGSASADLCAVLVASLFADGEAECDAEGGLQLLSD
jgi:hypothetical protein